MVNRLQSAFPQLQETADFQDLRTLPAANGSPLGSLQAWTGGPVDWLTLTVINNTADQGSHFVSGLAVWMGPSVAAPHFIFEAELVDGRLLLTLDLPARRDLIDHPWDVARDYNDLNGYWLEAQQTAEVERFVSPVPYVRAAMASPVALSLVYLQPQAGAWETIAERYFQHWWVREG